MTIHRRAAATLFHAPVEKISPPNAALSVTMAHRSAAALRRERAIVVAANATGYRRLTMMPMTVNVGKNVCIILQMQEHHVYTTAGCSTSGLAGVSESNGP